MKKNVFLLLCLFSFLGNSQAQNPSWSVKKLSHTSDVERNGEKGIEFVADYVVNNMMGKELQGFVMIYDANKQYLKNPSASSNYRSDSNGVFTCSEKLQSNYVSTSVTGCKAFLPYSQLPRTTGNAVYYYAFFLRDVTDNKWLSGNSDFGHFSLTWPFQKMLVNKTTELLNDGISYVEKEFYNDGTETWNYHHKCTNNHNGGQCSLCGGTGYLITKQSNININKSYSNGTEGFVIDYSWSSLGFLRSEIRQGTNIVSYNKQIIDNGIFWKLDNALISKDLKTLTINNKTYPQCSSEEYFRLYGKQ